MLNSYAEWHVTNCFFGCLTDKYYTIGDTTFKGHTYKFLDQFHYNKNFVIREDTSLQRIYMRIPGSATDTSEWLLYDFKLNVNDTMTLFNPGSPFPTNPGKFVLDSIILKPLLAKSYRHFYLHSTDTLASGVKNTVWAEGIGSFCLINTPGAPPKINGAGSLSCFFNSGTHEYQNLDSISSCLSVYPLSLVENVKHTTLVKIKSNPVSDKLQIISNEFDLDGLKIEILNLVGNVIRKEEYFKFIDVSSLPRGMYFIRFYMNQNLYSIKFIKY
ncbi:MAG: T9SS type A sorting domain-containing protein [Bacteroidota bacterium]|nr:T9SS type A sorting domain-containing protein [Bacteroidota bacterium]